MKKEKDVNAVKRILSVATDKTFKNDMNKIYNTLTMKQQKKVVNTCKKWDIELIKDLQVGLER